MSHIKSNVLDSVGSENVSSWLTIQTSTGRRICDYNEPVFKPDQLADSPLLPISGTES